MADQPKVKQKKPIQVLRERMGGLSDRMKAHLKDQRFIRSKMTAALKKGPSTVPEIAAQLEVDSGVIMWNMMALKRYGQVVEGNQRGDFFEYSLAEKE